MDRGASEVSSALGLNHSFADILTGIILFFIIGYRVLHHLQGHSA